MEKTLHTKFQKEQKKYIHMKKLFLALIVGITFTASSVQAQISMEQELPTDALIRIGKLDNGLTYYIKHGSEPRDCASFYIIQNVGALLEEDNQNGLAHFLEHMSFNGTKNFEGKEILNSLEKHGVAFGKNINAYTSFTETVYNLSNVPTNKPGLVDTCLLILHDWSDYLLLNEDEINLERGVINEEWRSRRTPSFRMRSQWFPVLLEGSKYAVRDIIGDTTVILHHKPETLRKFYHDWYRTDLQAIAIVGDIDVNEVEASIKKIFSEIKAVENPKERTSFPIPYHKDTRFVLATDKEAAQSSINVYIPHENNDEKNKTYADQYNKYIEALFNIMAQQRIQELLQKGVPPFISGNINHSDFVRGYDAFIFSASANPNEEEKALEAIATEVERIKRHGFTESELDRAKSNLLSSLETTYRQKDKIMNESFCLKIVNHFLIKEPVLNMDMSHQLANIFIPKITIEEISSKTKEWIINENRTVVVSGPSEGVSHLSKQKALNILEKVEKMDIEPYSDGLVSLNLIDKKLKGSKIQKTKEIPELNAVEWTLGNKAKVIYRKADFEKDQVTLNAFSFGGQSLISEEQLPSALMLSSIVSTYGVGQFDATSLEKMLTGKIVTVDPLVSDITEGFKCSSTPQDFETMMQLLYLYFEEPRFDAEAHDAIMLRYMSLLANIQKDPRKIMQDSLSLITTNYNKRTFNMSQDFIKKVNIKDVESIYRDRISDADDFTFIIVGNIEEETVRPLVEKYIGSMSSSKRKETFTDHKIGYPKGKTEKIIELPLTVPKATVFIGYNSEIEYKPQNFIAASVLNGILKLRYTEKIREEEGGTYSVNVGGNSVPFPSERTSFSISFECDPARAENLKSIIFREIDKIVEEGPSEVDFDKTVKNLLKEREEQSQHNSFYSKALFDIYYKNLNSADPANYEDILKNMTCKDIHDFTKRITKESDIVDIVFIPKNK